MEIVIFVVLTAILVGGLVLFKNHEEDLTYVHVKTENKYRVLQECRMKYDGKWRDAVIYVSTENNEVFVREYDDFMLNFKTYPEWKKTK